MLTKEMNDRVTRVGPGTPMGELMRRYWHPIAGSVQLDADNPTKEIRLLGEDLVLYRDASGTVGLIEPSCAHRKANLSYGIPEENGIRCAYHGWIFNETGQCMDQPSEPEGSKFKDKVRIKAYPVQEYAGVVWAYMGPAPTPLLPRWDVLEWEGHREWQVHDLPCNWLQCQENSLDPAALPVAPPLLRRLDDEPGEAARGARRLERYHRREGPRAQEDRLRRHRLRRHQAPPRRRRDRGQRVLAHRPPCALPNILRVAHGMQFRTPADDTHTLHISMTFRPFKDGEEPQTEVPVTEMPVFDDNGKLRYDYVLAQDQLAWVIQGPISDRTTERLGVTDVGVIMYRRLLDEQARVVEEGGEPMNIHRDEAENEIIILPCEYFQYPGYEGTGGPFKDVRPAPAEVEAVLSGEGAALSEWEGVRTLSGEERYAFR